MKNNIILATFFIFASACSNNTTDFCKNMDLVNSKNIRLEERVARLNYTIGSLKLQLKELKQQIKSLNSGNGACHKDVTPFLDELVK